MSDNEPNADWLYEVVAFVDDGPDDKGNPAPRMVCRYEKTGDPVHHVWKGRPEPTSPCLCGRREWDDYRASPELAAWKGEHDA